MKVERIYKVAKPRNNDKRMSGEDAYHRLMKQLPKTMGYLAHH